MFGPELAPARLDTYELTPLLILGVIVETSVSWDDARVSTPSLLVQKYVELNVQRISN